MDVVRLGGEEKVVAQKTKIRQAYIIPGSSLKGVIRSIVEAISPSCVRVIGWQTRPALPTRMKPCSDVNRLCPACRLFGMSAGRRENYAGQVHCEDAVLKEGESEVVQTPLLWAPARDRRGRLPRRYLSDHEAKGRKFYFHGTLAKGPDARIAAGMDSIFESRIRFGNLTGSEMGLLLAALGQHPHKPFLLKVGAGKPAGMGSVEVEVKAIVLLGDVRHSGRAGAGGERLEEEALKERIGYWLKEAEEGGLLDMEALDELWRILREENLSRPSPEGAY